MDLLKFYHFALVGLRKRLVFADLVQWMEKKIYAVSVGLAQRMEEVKRSWREGVKTDDLDAPVLVEGCHSRKRGASDHTEDDLESFEIVMA